MNSDNKLRESPLARPGTFVGGHASERDTCHVCAAYVLLRRWEASPPTLPPMR